MNTRYVIANWKMNLSLNESKQLAQKMKLKFIKKIWQRQVVLCPDFLSLAQVSTALEKSKIKLGAQDCFWQKKGSYTGEIDIDNLKSLGAEMVIVGHSERRTYLNENSKMINKKVKALLSKELIPIICIGEDKKTKKEKQTKNFLKKQLKEALSGVKLKKSQKIIIAYEPIWAIGNGHNMIASELVELLNFIRNEVAKIYSKNISEKNFVFIYGGSVNAKNVKSFSKYREIQGLLVGGSSLKIDSFSKICRNILE